MDPIAQFKENQKAAWAGFAALELNTATAAPRLVSFARIAAGNEVLDAMFMPALSAQHYGFFMEKSFGPAQKVLAMLDASDPPKAAAFRREMEELAALYFEDNRLRQDYLLTRAVKA